MDCSDLSPADFLCVLESKSQYALGGRSRDKLDTLHDAVNDDVFDPGVFTLGVFSNKYGVDIIVSSFISSNGFTRSDVGEQVESSAKGKIEGYMSFSNWSLSQSTSILFRRAGKGASQLVVLLGQQNSV